MKKNKKKVGVLLANIGSPDSPGVRDVRKYLKNFLSDPRVIDIPLIFRFLLLYLFILPFRPKRSSEAYKKIWLKEGSPLVHYSNLLAQNLSKELPSLFIIRSGHCYGEPSFQRVLNEFQELEVSEILICPLFPQYASASTGSVIEKIFSLISKWENVPSIRTLPPFYDHPLFIKAFCEKIKESLKDFKADFILFSYHGLPERQIKKSNQDCLKKENCCSKVKPFCYRSQCYETTRLFLKELQLETMPHATSFQSRLGRTPWIRPYTDVVIQELRQQGVENLLIVCPSFVIDCLETLEEMGLRKDEKPFKLVPCLNDTWPQELAIMIKEMAHPSE